MTRPHSETTWSIHRRRRWRRRVGVGAKRAALFGTGGTLLVASVAAVPTPFPGLGLLLFAAALYFMARGSRAARRAVKWSRRRMPPLSRGLTSIRPGLPRPMQAFIDQSDPGR